MKNTPGCCGIFSGGRGLFCVLLISGLEEIEHFQLLHQVLGGCEVLDLVPFFQVIKKQDFIYTLISI